MTLAQEMFAIAPAYGTASLSLPQIGLLAGKARWIYEAAAAGFPVTPTIVLTRAAWEGLEAERRVRDDRLRRHWVATLFRLVDRGGVPPELVVRTSAPRHSAGLMPAVTGLAAPRNEGIWDDVRAEIASSMNSQRGQAKERLDGPFGTELHGKLPGDGGAAVPVRARRPHPAAGRRRARRRAPAS